MTPKTEYPWTVRLLVDSIKSFGVTTVIVCVLLWVTVKVVIPEMIGIANRYCDTAEQTQKQMLGIQERLVNNQDAILLNQDRIVETQTQLVGVVQDMSTAAQEIIACEQQSQLVLNSVEAFMSSVKEEHEKQTVILENIEQAVVEP
jgi:hypothetical protein